MSINHNACEQYRNCRKYIVICDRNTFGNTHDSVLQKDIKLRRMLTINVKDRKH